MAYVWGDFMCIVMGDAHRKHCAEHCEDRHNDEQRVHPQRHAAVVTAASRTPPRPRTLSKLWWHHAILEMMSHARPAPVVATEAPRQPHGATREGVRHGRRAWRRRARHRVMIAGRWRRRRLPRRRRQLLSEP